MRNLSSFLFQFGFEFVGRLLGEHVHLGGFLLEEVGDDLRVEGDGGTEVVRLHVMEDGVPQLSCHVAVFKVSVDVDGGHQQAAAQHVGFHHHAQFPGDVP